MSPTPAPASTLRPSRNTWVRRLGAAGFAFFLIKGLLWIFLPILAAKGILAVGDGQPARQTDTRLVAD